MSEHTPGPWITDGVCIYPKGQAGNVIAGTVNKDCPRGFHTKVSGEGEQMANAHLIAASADMLEALGKFVVAYAKDIETTPAKRQAYFVAVETIAKAEGKAS